MKMEALCFSEAFVIIGYYSVSSSRKSLFKFSSVQQRPVTFRTVRRYDCAVGCTQYNCRKLLFLACIIT